MGRDVALLLVFAFRAVHALSALLARPRVLQCHANLLGEGDPRRYAYFLGGAPFLRGHDGGRHHDVLHRDARGVRLGGVRDDRPRDARDVRLGGVHDDRPHDDHGAHALGHASHLDAALPRVRNLFASCRMQFPEVLSQALRVQRGSIGLEVSLPRNWQVLFLPSSTVLFAFSFLGPQSG